MSGSQPFISNNPNVQAMALILRNQGQHPSNGTVNTPVGYFNMPHTGLYHSSGPRPPPPSPHIAPPQYQNNMNQSFMLYNTNNIASSSYSRPPQNHSISNVNYTHQQQYFPHQQPNVSSSLASSLPVGSPYAQQSYPSQNKFNMDNRNNNNFRKNNNNNNNNNNRGNGNNLSANTNSHNSKNNSVNTSTNNSYSMYKPNTQTPICGSNNTVMAAAPCTASTSGTSTAAVLTLYCEPCERDFPTQAAMDAHLKSHSKCSFPNCNFEATGKMVSNHYSSKHVMAHKRGLQLVSIEGQQFQVLMGTDPEEVTRWREERKSKFPTAENVTKKKAEQQQLVESGGLTAPYAYPAKGKNRNNKNNNNNDKNNNKRKRSADESDSSRGGDPQLSKYMPSNTSAVTAAAAAVIVSDIVSGDDDAGSAPIVSPLDDAESAMKQLHTQQLLQLQQQQHGKKQKQSNNMSSNASTDATRQTNATDKTNTKLKLCRFFFRKGGVCKSGDKCNFSHVKSSPTQPSSADTDSNKVKIDASAAVSEVILCSTIESAAESVTVSAHAAINESAAAAQQCDPTVAPVITSCACVESDATLSTDAENERRLVRSSDSSSRDVEGGESHSQQVQSQSLKTTTVLTNTGANSTTTSTTCTTTADSSAATVTAAEGGKRRNPSPPSKQSAHNKKTAAANNATTTCSSNSSSSREPSLLQRLLTDQVDREENAVLQCLHLLAQRIRLQQQQ